MCTARRQEIHDVAKFPFLLLGGPVNGQGTKTAQLKRNSGTCLAVKPLVNVSSVAQATTHKVCQWQQPRHVRSVERRSFLRTRSRSRLRTRWLSVSRLLVISQKTSKTLSTTFLDPNTNKKKTERNLIRVLRMWVQSLCMREHMCGGHLSSRVGDHAWHAAHECSRTGAPRFTIYYWSFTGL